MPVRDLTDEEILEMRRRGELECRCYDPIPDPAFTLQCGRCYKKIPT